MENYKKRIADELLKEKLSGAGAVLIEGPKWCGKTTTAEQVSKSIIYMADPRKKQGYLLRAETDPSSLLEGEKPKLIDEWQLAPELWDAIRFEVDHAHAFGQFILTGSAVPPETDKITHTGTGRFSRLRMHSMSLYESGESNGTVSLGALFDNPDKLSADCDLKLEDVCYLICRGGWPLSTYLFGKIALNQARDYYDSVVSSDINRADGVQKDSEKVRRLMRSFARLQGSQAGDETIAADIETNEPEKVSSVTVHNYISALKKIFVVEDMEAWNPNLRSKTVIRTADTRYFTDPSLAAAALGFGPGDLLEDTETCGLMFETLAVRDLRVYASTLDGEVYHFRDKSGLECDAVVHLRNGSYGLIEIKLGGESLIEKGAKSLKDLEKIIDTERMKKPSFKMILTANSPMAYKRSDGIFVVPIGCLKH